MRGKGERTRQALLDAAVERFARDGYRATSVAEIARDVGLSGTAAYAYFPNKQALFVAAVDQDTAGVIGEAWEEADTDAGAKGIETLLPDLLQSLDRHLLARRILAGLEPDFTVRLLAIPALDELRRSSRQALLARQARGAVRADIDGEEIATGMIAITVSLLMALVQTGAEPAVLGGRQVRAVLDAALIPPRPSTTLAPGGPPAHDRHERAETETMKVLR
jgi:AcrR family transcriptional regulator